MGQANSHIRTVANADGVAILDIEAGKITTVNSTGAFVWEALRRGESAESIASSLARETGEQLATLKRDVSNFIDGLKKQGLLPR